MVTRPDFAASEQERPTREPALRRARAELHTRPNTIDALAELQAAGALPDDEVVDLAMLRRLLDARRVRTASWRGPWRREAREQALERTRAARARVDALLASADTPEPRPRKRRAVSRR